MGKVTGPTLAEDVVAVKAALETFAVSADKIGNYTIGRNIFFYTQ